MNWFSWLIWMGSSLLMLLVGVYIGHRGNDLEAHTLRKRLRLAATPLLGFPGSRHKRGWCPDRWTAWQARAKARGL